MLAGAVRRWWPVVVVGLLLTAAGIVTVGMKIHASYAASGSVVLLHASDRGGTNPYTQFDGSLNVTSDALITVINGEATRTRLEAEGADPHYTLVRATTSPFLTASVTTPSDARSVKTVRLVLQAVGDELTSRQRKVGANPSSYIVADSLTVPDRATPVWNRRIRATGAVILLGVLLTLAVTIACEVLFPKRRRARLGRADTPPSPTTTEAKPYTVARTLS
jgi:hypothetical protein